MPDLPALVRLAGNWQLYFYIYVQNLKTNVLYLRSGPGPALVRLAIKCQLNNYIYLENFKTNVLLNYGLGQGSGIQWFF